MTQSKTKERRRFERTTALLLLTLIGLGCLMARIHQPLIVDAARRAETRHRRAGTSPVQLQSIAIGTHHPIAERVGAFRALERHDRSKRDDNPDARTPEVISAVSALFTRVEEPDARADILRHVRNSKHMAARDMYLAALSDTSDRVREIAADALESFVANSPDVVEALERVRDGDPATRVRAEARDSLTSISANQPK